MKQKVREDKPSLLIISLLLLLPFVIALALLPYVRQHLFGGKTFTRIAKDEEKSIKTVQEGYIAAIKKMKKFLKTPSNLDS